MRKSLSQSKQYSQNTQPTQFSEKSNLVVREDVSNLQETVSAFPPTPGFRSACDLRFGWAICSEHGLLRGRGQFHETRGLHAVGFGTHEEATNVILRDYSALVAYIVLVLRLLLPILLFTVVIPGRWLQRTRCTCLI